MSKSKNDPECQRRQCVRCKHYFSSDWAGNRVCKPCRKKNEKLDKGIPCFDIENSGYPLPPERESFLREPAFAGGTSNMKPSTSSQASES